MTAARSAYDPGLAFALRREAAMNTDLYRSARAAAVAAIAAACTLPVEGIKALGGFTAIGRRAFYEAVGDAVYPDAFGATSSYRNLYDIAAQDIRLEGQRMAREAGKGKGGDA